MTKQKSTDFVQLKLRMRDALHRRVVRVAGKANRSMNAEIVNRLESSFAAQDLTEVIKQCMREVLTESFTEEAEKVAAELAATITIARMGTGDLPN